MATMKPMSECKVNDIIVYQVGGDPVRVVSDSPCICLSDGYKATGGEYVTVVGKLNTVHYMRNQSGVSHAYVGSRSLCGTRHTQNESSANHATCKRCLALLNDDSAVNDYDATTKAASIYAGV